MIYIKETTDFRLAEKSAVTLGKFDGMHLGHRLLLDRVIAAKEQGLQAVVFTFDRSPKEVFSHHEEKALMTNEERAAQAEEMGIDVLIEAPFVPEIYAMPPEIFIRSILIDRLKTSYLAVGTDYRFGAKAAGDAEMLKEAAREYGFAIDVIDIRMCRGIKISSTYARKMISEGKMDAAAEHLGYRYRITGRAEEARTGCGVKRFIPASAHKLLPCNGRYPVTVRYADADVRIHAQLLADGKDLFLEGFSGDQTESGACLTVEF